VIDRLDERMALEQSRGKAKEEARAAHQKTWAFTTGKIHSYKTRSSYQEQSLRFAIWARDTYALKHLEEIEVRKGELTAEFLQTKINEGKSAYTLQLIRSALRMLFGDWTLMQEVQLPKRSRATITRSRGAKDHDKYFNPTNWPKLVSFLKATGLRRDEVKMLRAGDILERERDSTSEYYGQTIVQVRNGKGGKSRKVPVLAGHEQAALVAKEGLAEQEIVFLRIPKHLDVHSYRREYAQALYLYYVECNSSLQQARLPPSTGRLKCKDYDRGAAEKVTRALGHNRIDVVLWHYIR
jgi:integrase